MRSRVGSRGLLSILPVHPLYVPAGYPIFYPYFHCEFPMRFLDHFTVGSRAIPGGSIERTFRFACDLPAFPCASSKWFPSGNFVFTPCFCCGCSPQISVRFSICSFSVLLSDPIGFPFVFSAVQHAFPWYAPPCVL